MGLKAVQHPTFVGIILGKCWEQLEVSLEIVAGTLASGHQWVPPFEIVPSLDWYQRNPPKFAQKSPGFYRGMSPVQSASRLAFCALRLGPDVAGMGHP